MFVEEGFRIRFANGEVIDFYADSTAEKEGWMKVLSETVGKNSTTGSGKAWTELILKQEQALAARKAARNVHQEMSPRKPSREMPQLQTSPRKLSKELPHPYGHPQSPRKQQHTHESMMHGALPTPSSYSPTQLHPSRPTHARRESHQEGPVTSPMKDKLAARHQKTRSMIM